MLALAAAALAAWRLVAAPQDAAEAVAALEKALASNASNRQALRGLAAAYASVADPRAEATFQRALAASPENLELRHEHAEFLWRQGRYEEGNAEMERVLARSPADAQRRGRYGELLMEQSRFVQAASQLARACQPGGCPVDRLELWANALLETGRFSESARIWRLALAAEPTRAQTHEGLGRLLMLQGDSTAALAELRRAARLDPSAPGIRVDCGRALEASGQSSGAETAYREALRLDPGFSPAHLALGTLLSRLGRIEEARSEIALYQTAFDAEQRARQLAGARRAQITLGWTRLQASDAEGALAAFGALSDDPEALRGRGEALLSLGRREEARRAFERALTLAPEDPRIRWALERSRGTDSAP